MLSKYQIRRDSWIAGWLGSSLSVFCFCGLGALSTAQQIGLRGGNNTRMWTSGSWQKANELSRNAHIKIYCTFDLIKKHPPEAETASTAGRRVCA